MSEEETDEQHPMSSTAYGSPRRVSSPTSVQGELFVWIQSVKKELDTLLESASSDYNLLLKKIERVINKLEDGITLGVEVETRSSRSPNSDQLVKRIELDISGTIKTSSLRERFVDGIEALQEAEGRLFSALDGILARGINRLKEDLKRISSTMVSVAGMTTSPH